MEEDVASGLVLVEDRPRETSAPGDVNARPCDDTARLGDIIIRPECFKDRPESRPGS